MVLVMFIYQSLFILNESHVSNELCLNTRAYNDVSSN